ncbi:MAG: amino acid ABC transporter permease [Spirochaetales bacterium]|nr:amino acid ABC transporter permease [Spirochaetales bacterium]
MLLPAGRVKKRVTWLDGVLLIIIAAGAVYLVHRVRTRLNYSWNWSIIGKYMVRRNENGRIVPNLLLEGLLTTLRLSIWSSVLAMVIGTIAAVLRLRKSVFFRFFGRIYVELVRNIPPLVLVFIFYFFIGNQIMSALRIESLVARAGPGTEQVLRVLFADPRRLSEFFSAVLTLGIYEGAYMSEIIRAGIESVPKGQWEAGYSLGLGEIDRYRYVILPQALRNILPALAGQFISAIKDSAIVAVISVQELTFQGLELMSTTYRTFEIWITIIALYLVLTGTLSAVARRVELRLARKG